METTTTQERRKLINDCFIDRKLNGFESLGAPRQEAFNKVNESITEKTNTLQTRLNELENELKAVDLHNHYY